MSEFFSGPKANPGAPPVPPPVAAGGLGNFADWGMPAIGLAMQLINLFTKGKGNPALRGFGSGLQIGGLVSQLFPGANNPFQQNTGDKDKPIGGGNDFNNAMKVSQQMGAVGEWPFGATGAIAKDLFNKRL